MNWIKKRNHIQIMGSGTEPIIFAHGYGCDQTMWRLLTPDFVASHRIILYDHVGAGHSDLSAYSSDKYATLSGYAEDLIEIVDALNLSEAVFVGHSVSSIIGVLAAKARPGLFSKLIMIGPSPCYLNDEDYQGGFDAADIDGLLELLDQNHLGWSATMAPTIMGNPDRPELAEELKNSFCRTDPDIAKEFARVTFRSDNRSDLADLHAPTLVLQCSEDAIAPEVVGKFVSATLPNATYHKLSATGHCPHLSHPKETADAIHDFLSQ